MTPIKFSVGVDEQSKQLVDAYTMPRRLKWFFSLLFRQVQIIWRPKWYKYFDSFDDRKDYSMDDPALSSSDK